MNNFYIHRVNTIDHNLALNERLVVNGTTTLTKPHPDNWAAMSDVQKTTWLKNNLIINAHLYKRREHSTWEEWGTDKWDVVGTVKAREILLDLYDISFGRYLLTGGFERGLVGSPTNMRGVRGFDSLTTSRVVGFQIDNKDQLYCIVQTYIGRNAHSRLKKRLFREWIDSFSTIKGPPKQSQWGL